MVATIDDICWNADGLVPVVTRDGRSGAVLMVAWMNSDALQQTLDSGWMTYYSRSRQQLWRKGETSGHTQQLLRLRLDCDGDTLLADVRQTGAACHSGAPTCFFRDLYRHKTGIGADAITMLETVIDQRISNGHDNSYVAQLQQRGEDAVLKKVIEEAGEVVLAAKSNNNDALTHESADLLFHLLVTLRQRDVDFAAVTEILAARAGTSGVTEKARRTH